MLDVHGHNPSSAPKKREGMNGTSLTQWIHQQVGIPQVQVRSRLRGNSLHILFESKPCPDAAVVMPPLTQSLSANILAGLLPPDASPVYRVIAYGRLPQHATPEWTESFVPNPSDRLEGSERSPQNEAPPEVLSTARDTQERNIEAAAGSPVDQVRLLDQARCGQPEAIARYLSETCSHLGIAVRARLEKKRSQPDQHAAPSLQSTSDQPPPKRLFIACESAYSPDPQLLAEPIAQQLRALDLKGFQDAVIFGQVVGEAKPEWLLRIDLTPPDDMLREWARWGDVQAITRLLNRLLLPQQVQVFALLKEATLHLTCRGVQSFAPDKLTTIAAIVPLLESLSPQGIRAATIYGFANQESSADLLNATSNPAPLWVHWLDLLAAQSPASTLDRAQEGHLDAIAFLLTRLLNPDLDNKLATGGIRVQIRQKADLLHVMSEALICPSQSQVGPAIARFLKPLQIPAIAGVRIYGRRSGQKQPLWSYGVDFASRHRLVPEATPEFAVSDAYVGDLFAPPGALVLRTEQPSEESRSALSQLLDGMVQRLQRSLIWSQLFVPLEPDHRSPSASASHSLIDAPQRGIRVAAVWSAVGLLLIVQSDWVVGQWLQPTQPSPTVAQPSPPPSPAVQVPSQPSFPKLLPGKNKPREKTGEPDVFNASGFTQSREGQSTSQLDNESQTSTTLPASPPRPNAGQLTQGSEAYPTFNSRQLDEKIALYHTYLAEHGAPDILIIGSSRALRGVDPIALEKALAEQGYSGATIFNFGVNGATAQVVDIIMRQLLPQDKLPKLVLWADGARAFNSGRTDVTYNGILASNGYRTLTAGTPPIPGTPIAQMPATAKAIEPPQLASVSEEAPTSLAGGYQAVNQTLNQRLGALSALYSQRDRLKALLRDNLASLLPKSTTTLALGGANSFWDARNSAPSHISDATSPSASAANTPSSVLSEGQMMIDIDGFLPLSNRFNPATYYQKYARVNGDYDSDYEAFNLEGKQTQALTNLAQFSQTHQIPLIFVNLPLTKDYLDSARKQHEEDFQQQMLRLAPQLGFIYRDLNQSLVDQPDYFSDPSHLNRYGAYEVSRRLAVDVMIPWNQVRK